MVSTFAHDVVTSPLTSFPLQTTPVHPLRRCHRKPYIRSPTTATFYSVSRSYEQWFSERRNAEPARSLTLAYRALQGDLFHAVFPLRCSSWYFASSIRILPCPDLLRHRNKPCVRGLLWPGVWPSGLPLWLLRFLPLLVCALRLLRPRLV